jgi:dTDP-glucose 4,6-dehydratase
MAKILVTGGSGFIGTNLVHELESRGHDVLVSDIRHSERENFKRCDVREFRQLENVLDGKDFEFVYHLAAEYGRRNGEDLFENLWETNVIGTKNVLTAQQKKKFRLIQFSSCEVYGDYDGVITEELMDKVPIKQLNDYAMSKWVNEMQVQNAQEKFGTESVRVRLLNAYGPHEHYSPYRGVIPIFIYNAMHDKPITVYSSHRRIFDYVEDTCRTLANIVENFKSGAVYNLGADKEVSIDHVLDLILKSLNKDNRHVTYKGFEPFTTRFKKVDSSKAKRDLNHDPKTQIEEGIPKTIVWMKKLYST